MSSIYCKNAKIDLNDVRSIKCNSENCTIEYVNDPEVYIASQESSCYLGIKRFHDLMMEYQTTEKKQSVELTNHAVRINNIMAQAESDIFNVRDKERKNIKSEWIYPYN